MIDSAEFPGRPGEDALEVEESGDPECELPIQPRFGAWQALFQPFFPQWREILELPKSPPRAGIFLFRVALGTAWRLISMPSDDTLDDLVHWVLRSVKFGSDHLYELRYRDRLGAEVCVVHPQMDEGPRADQVPIGTLPLEPGQMMQLTYDFGDRWMFAIRLIQIEPPNSQIMTPQILVSQGKAPSQYH